MLLRAECRLQEKVSSGQDPCIMSNHRIKVSLEGMSSAVGQWNQMGRSMEECSVIIRGVLVMAEDKIRKIFNSCRSHQLNNEYFNLLYLL